jgi:para-aminobenzoate synthetase component 2
MVRILVLDNYDSFVYTLNGYLRQLGAQTEVLRNDAFAESELPEMLSRFDAVLISPGPGTPASAGLSIPTVRFALETDYPVFGVCLGHQAIAEAMGAVVESAPELMHGKVSTVNHQGSPIFEGLPQGFSATRYHSLAVVPESIPEDLLITGQTESGVIMSLQHKTKPIYGVQFHPESVMTQGGYIMLANWLETLGLEGARKKALTLSPRIENP